MAGFQQPIGGRAASGRTFREVITVDGRNIVLDHESSPVAKRQTVAAGDALYKLDVFDAAFRPENYNKADGSPLRLFDAATVKVDLSKRSKEDMGFRRRNIDFHEIIFCVRGALRRETEIGATTLKAGEMILIPKGISHRSMLCDESAEENVLLELKIDDEIAFVGRTRG
jgi:hypothetical protein